MRLAVLVLILTVVIPLSIFAANPSNWDRALQLYQGGNYSGALSELNKIANGGASVHYLIGMCYKNMGKSDQAKRELTWVANYAPDEATKSLAQTALTQLRCPPIPALNQPGSPWVGNKFASASSSSAPSKALINDSVSQTISAAAQSGWRPCTGRCLNVNTPGWHHEQVDGHSDTENWHTFRCGGNPRACTTAHWGEIFDESGESAVSKGSCPVCGGTGWIKK